MGAWQGFVLGQSQRGVQAGQRAGAVSTVGKEQREEFNNSLKEFTFQTTLLPTPYLGAGFSMLSIGGLFALLSYPSLP